jgi:hypothetical protein
MPVYRVKTPVERANKLYIPEDKTRHGSTWPSASHGGMIPVDGTGFVEMPEHEARPLLGSALAGLDDEVQALKVAKKKAQEDLDKANADLKVRQQVLKRVMDKKKELGVQGTEAAAIAEAKTDSPAEEAEAGPAAPAPAGKDKAGKDKAGKGK